MTAKVITCCRVCIIIENDLQFSDRCSNTFLTNKFRDIVDESCLVYFQEVVVSNNLRTCNNRTITIINNGVDCIIVTVKTINSFTRNKRTTEIYKAQFQRTRSKVNNFCSCFGSSTSYDATCSKECRFNQSYRRDYRIVIIIRFVYSVHTITICQTQRQFFVLNPCTVKVGVCQVIVLLVKILSGLIDLKNKHLVTRLSFSDSYVLGNGCSNFYRSNICQVINLNGRSISRCERSITKGTRCSSINSDLITDRVSAVSASKNCDCIVLVRDCLELLVFGQSDRYRV